MKLDNKTKKYLEEMKINLGETSPRFNKLKNRVLENEASKIIKSSKKNKPKKIKSYPVYKKFQKLKHSQQDKETINYLYETFSNLNNKPISNITIKDLVFRFNRLELQKNKDKITELQIKKTNLQKQIRISYKNSFKFALDNIKNEIETLNKGIVELYRYKKMLEQIIQHSIKVRNQITKITPLIQDKDISTTDTTSLLLFNKEVLKIIFYENRSIEVVKVVL